MEKITPIDPLHSPSSHKPVRILTQCITDSKNHGSVNHFSFSFIPIYLVSILLI